MDETTLDMRGVDHSRAWLWLKQRWLTEVVKWLREQPVDLATVPKLKTKLIHAMHARAMIALSREHPEETYLPDALELLAALLDLAVGSGWGKSTIENLALQSLALDLGGDTAHALMRLDRALDLAAPEGYVRTFVGEGPPMARLLYEALSRGMASGYVRRLLSAFPESEPLPTAASSSTAPPADLIEPLSERELYVLHLIAEGLTNPGIASTLFLSAHTIKTHMRNIYGKLSVHSRMQAAARSLALGLLSHP